MAVYESIINNVQKVAINEHDRTVTVYYNAYDTVTVYYNAYDVTPAVSVGDFPANDWSHIQEDSSDKAQV